MVITGSNGEYAITRLTGIELNVILGIITTVNDRCFERPDEDGNWYSNDDFVQMLTDEQRTALHKIGHELELIYSE